MAFRRMIHELQRAFAVPTADAPPTERELYLVDAVCRDIVRRRLTPPALALLEMSRPLNFLGAQAMHFFTPIIAALSDATGPQEFAQFLERRDSIDILIERIETLEHEWSQPPADSASAPPENESSASDG